MFQDLRYALRTLAKSRGFAIVSILVVALGIAANTAVFSIVNGVLLRPLPYQNPDGLLIIQERIPKFLKAFIPFSAPDVMDLERDNRTLVSVAGFEPREMNLSNGVTPKRSSGARVSASLFPMLGVSPMLGRTFTRQEDRPGQRLVVLGYGLWQDAFGADRGVVGKNILLDGRPYAVLGVMPRGFTFPPRGISANGLQRTDAPEFWVPMAFSDDELKNVVDNFNIGVVARMKPGIRVQQAQADANSVARQVEAKYPFAYKDGLTLEMGVTPLDEVVVGSSRRILILLLGAVGFVLLIACANIANLLLTRAAARHRELAIRAALGAGRARMIRQLLTESGLLALLGGLAGIALAWLGLDAFVAVLPPSMTHSLDIQLDPQVLGFAVALTVATGVLIGVIPAISAARGNLAESLKEMGRGSTSGARRTRIKNALAVAEIALSLVLLTGAGLLIRSYVDAVNTNPGFEPEHVLSFLVDLPQAQYGPPARVRSFYQELESKLATVPGVRSVAVATSLPLGGATWTRTFRPEGWTNQPGKQVPLTAFTVTDGPYFQALGIPLIRGRYFTEADRTGSEPVAIVDQEVARRYWPDVDPIGKRMRFGGLEDKTPLITIVGVVADARMTSVEAGAETHCYQPAAQAGDGPLRTMNVVVRAQRDPASLTSAVRSAVASIDRNLPVAQLRTMTDALNTTLEPRRFNTALLAAFAAIALLLAIIGIHGVISYSVTQRTQEIGIRMALGADRRDVLRIILREGLVLAAAGIAIGAAASLALTRFLASLLYGVKATDPVTFASVAAVLAAATLASAWLPARRAMNVEPMLALRRE